MQSCCSLDVLQALIRSNGPGKDLGNAGIR